MDNRKLILSNKTIFLTFLSRAAQAIGSVVLLFLTARWGGAHVRGEISMLLATLTLGSHLASWIGGGTLVYWVNRHSPRKLLVVAMAWSVLVSLLSGILLPLTPYGLAMGASNWSITFLILNTSVVVRSMLVALNRIRTDNLLGLLALGVQLPVLVFLMGYSGQNSLSGFVMAFNSGQLILILAGIFPLFDAIKQKSNPVNEATTPSIFGSLLKTGSWAQLASLSQFFAYRILYYFLSMQNGLDAVGRFSVAVALGESVWLLTRSVSLSQATTISAIENEQEARDLTRMWYKRVGLLSALSIGALLIVPNTIWIQILGPDYLGIPDLLLFLAPGLWFLSVSNILAHHQAGKGRYSINAYSSLASLTTLSLGLILIPSTSLESVAALQSLAYLAGWTVQYKAFAQTSR
jgi:O-antigen/teichoic acid export membrane protein